MEKRNYRITSWRFDIPEEILEEPTFEEETEKECDEKAIARMKELSKEENNQWDGVKIVRIDVVEKTTFIADNGKQK